MTDSITPRMSWDDPDLPSAIQIFRQQSECQRTCRNCGLPIPSNHESYALHLVPHVIAVASKITGVKCVNHRIHDRTKVS